MGNPFIGKLFSLKYLYSTAKPWVLLFPQLLSFSCSSHFPSSPSFSQSQGIYCWSEIDVFCTILTHVPSKRIVCICIATAGLVPFVVFSYIAASKQADKRNSSTPTSKENWAFTFWGVEPFVVVCVCEAIFV